MAAGKEEPPLGFIQDAIDKVWESTKKWTDNEREEYLNALDADQHLLFMDEDEAMGMNKDEVMALLEEDYKDEEDAMRQALEEKQLGTDAFRGGVKMYGNALRHWRLAVQHASHGPHTLERDQLVSTVHANMAVVFMRRKHWPAAIGAAEAAAEAFPGNVKAHMRVAQACIEMGYWRRAEKAAIRALKADAGVEEEESEEGGESVGSGELVKMAPNGKELGALLRRARIGAERVEREKREWEEKVARSRREREEARKAAKERGLRVGPPLFGDETSGGGVVRAPKVVRGEESEMLMVPVRVVFPEAHMTEVVEHVSELASVGDVVETVLHSRPPWDVRGAHAPATVKVFYQSFIAPPRNIEHAWRDVEEEEFREAKEYIEEVEEDKGDWRWGLRAAARTAAIAAASGGGSAEAAAATGSTPWVQLQPHTPLLFLMVQPDFVLADIPVIYVVPKDSTVLEAMRKDCKGVEPRLLAAPSLDSLGGPP